MDSIIRHLLQYADTSSLGWVFGIGVVVAFVMGFATGANDVANTFGTSVGSGALTLKKALIVAGVCEMLGAISLGSRVADTIQKGIADPTCFNGAEGLLMAGMLAALCSAGAWLLFASIFGLPVSTTHSIVGSVVGMGLVFRGADCIKWDGLIRIAISWVASPLLSGLVAFVLYFIILRIVVHALNPVRNTFWALPVLFSGTTAFLLALILNHALHNKFEVWVMVLIIVGASLFVGIISHFVFVPWLKRNLERFTSPRECTSLPLAAGEHETIQLAELNTNQEEESDENNIVELEKSEESNGSEAKNDGKHAEPVVEKKIALDSVVGEELVSVELKASAAIIEGGAAADGPVDALYLERQKARKLFFHIQLFSASLGAFAHGANDTANAIGPFAAIFFLWQGTANWTSLEVPIWMVALGGASIVAGLSILGHKVIKTMGTDITHVDYVNGFTTELSSGMTVVLASALKVPVSSTHCQVGAIVGVGLVPDKDKKVSGVNWKLFGKIFASWIITVPVSGGVAALLACLFSLIIRA